jgi:hypothetical protein
MASFCLQSVNLTADRYLDEQDQRMAPLCRPFLFGRTLRHDPRLTTHAASRSSDLSKATMPRARLRPLICADPLLILLEGR